MIIRKKEEKTIKERLNQPDLTPEDYFILTAEKMLEAYAPIKEAISKNKDKSVPIKDVYRKVVTKLDTETEDIHHANRLISAFKNWLFLTEPKLKLKDSNVLILLMLMNEWLESALEAEEALKLARKEDAKETADYLNPRGILALDEIDTANIYTSLDVLRYYLAGVNTEIDLIADEYKITRLKKVKLNEKDTFITHAIRKHNSFIKSLTRLAKAVEDPKEKEEKLAILKRKLEKLPLKVETDPTAIERAKFYTANYFEMILDGNIPQDVQNILELRHDWDPKDLSYEEDRELDEE